MRVFDKLLRDCGRSFFEFACLYIANERTRHTHGIVSFVRVKSLVFKRDERIFQIVGHVVRRQIIFLFIVYFFSVYVVKDGECGFGWHKIFVKLDAACPGVENSHGDRKCDEWSKNQNAQRRDHDFPVFFLFLRVVLDFFCV